MIPEPRDQILGAQNHWVTCKCFTRCTLITELRCSTARHGTGVRCDVSQAAFALASGRGALVWIVHASRHVPTTLLLGGVVA